MSVARWPAQRWLGRGRLLALVCTLLLVSPAPAADKDKKDEAAKKPDLAGQIAAVSFETRTLTLTVPPKVKGDDPTSVVVKFTDQTKFSYFGVEGAGETPMVGYVALVWLVEGSKDTAAGVRLGRKDADGGKGPNLVGQIVAVAADTKTITVEVEPKEKGEKPTRHEVKFTDKTKFSYFGVDQAGEIPTVGYVALVWLAEGSKSTAVGIRLGLKQ